MMNFALNIGARTEAGIQHILFSQLPYRSFIISQVRGLAAHRLVPRQAEPSEVLNDGRFIFRPAAAEVDILDAQQESPTLGLLGRKQCRFGMP